MKLKTFLAVFFLLTFANAYSFTISCFGNTVGDINQVMVWTFNECVFDETDITEASYVNPQYCKRAWFKYFNMPWDIFADPIYDLQRIPPLLNDFGSLFEGGVQVAQLCPDAGWPCDNIYDDDHEYPFVIPDPVFDDYVTWNAEGVIYHQPNDDEYLICNASIANENYRDYVLYWAYEQIDANVNALEFDEIDGGYQFGIEGTGENNSNTGYDDYAIGVANFSVRLSVKYNQGMIDPISWFMPAPNASSQVNPAEYAFDGDPETYWRSFVSTAHWIEIDFGRSRTVQQVYVQLHEENLLENFDIKYWSDITGWTDFTPAINITENNQFILSFLVEPVTTSKIRLFSSDDEVYLCELQFFGKGFRQFLLKKYCEDGDWTPDDSRWESEKQVVFSDPNQCPDGTMNTFNYRKYLEYHGWTENPFGCEVTIDNYLDPENPFFIDWLPVRYVCFLMFYFLSDDELVDHIENLYSESYSYQRLYLGFWRTVCDNVRKYAQDQGKEIYITSNGSNLLPHYVDYMMSCMGEDGVFPAYAAPSSTDPDKISLDGSQAQINLWRLIDRRAVEYLGRDAPLVSFCDFWQLGMPFAHLGGIDEPADERAVYLKTYAMEMLAAGVHFCFPVMANEENAWLDQISDGTPLIMVIRQLTNFINWHKEIYQDVVVNCAEDRVTVNGVVPFNGEWNIVDDRIFSPVNESKVTIAYTDSNNYPKSYLHIINHYWDDLQHTIIPQENVEVRVPVAETCTGVSIVSPDSPLIIHEFYCEDNYVNLVIPNLEFYAAIILDISPAPTPTVTNTPAPSATPSPTASIPDLGLYLNLSKYYFYPGDLFILRVLLSNPGPQTYESQPIAILLDVYSNYFWYPSWDQDFNFETVDIGIGFEQMEILNFVWPMNCGRQDGIFFYGAILNKTLDEIIGNWSQVSFGYADL